MAEERVGLSFTIGAVLSNTFRSSFRGASNQISSIGNSIRELSRQRLDINRQIGLNPANAELYRERLSEINRELSRLRAARRIEVVIDTHSENMRREMASLGKITAGTAVGAGIMSIPIRTAMEFEQAMLNVKSVINGITDEDFADLVNEAKRFGSTTSFSASEAASGMKYLAMAGFQTNDIIASMPGLLDMAKAGVIDLGKASDISSNILSGFGLQASEMTRVADTLTMAFTTSNTTLESLGYTMKYVAPIARAAGMSLEEASAMAGLLGNIGIQGEMAGTQLRAMINRLSAPAGPAEKMLKSLGVTVKDSMGNLRPMIEILSEMEEKTASMGNADRLAAFKTIFGEEAVSGLTELVNQAGSGGISKYLEIVKNSSGKASQVAKIQMSGVTGAVTELKSAAEGLSITFGTLFFPAMSMAANGMKSFSNILNAGIEKYPTLTRGIFYAVAGFTAYAVAVKTLTIANSALGIAMATLSARTLIYNGVVRSAGIITKAMTVAQWALNAAFLSSPIGWVVAGIGAVIGAGIALYKNWDKVPAFFISAWESMKEKALQVGSFFIDIGVNIAEFYKGVWSNIIDTIMKPMEMIKGGISKVKSWLWGDSESIEVSKSINTVPVNEPMLAPYFAPNGPVQNSSISNNVNTPINYNPTINISGNASKSEVLEATRLSQKEFESMYKKQIYNDARLSLNGI